MTKTWVVKKVSCLGLHVHEVQTLGVDADVDADDFVVAGAGFGVNLSGEEGGAVGWDVPAVLQEEALQVVHLFTHALAGTQSLSEGKETSVGFRGTDGGKMDFNSHTLYS